MLEPETVGWKPVTYNLDTLEPESTTLQGFKLNNLLIGNIDQGHWISFSPLTHPHLPDTRKEVAYRDMVSSYDHLEAYAHAFPYRRPHLKVKVLLGIDTTEAMRSQTYGTRNPYVQRSPLGYSLVGTSDGFTDKSKTHDSVFYASTSEAPNLNPHINAYLSELQDSEELFKYEPGDFLPGLSQEDEKFLSIMKKGFHLDQDRNMVLPLPLKDQPTPPLNGSAVFHRARGIFFKLKEQPEKLEACIKNMQNYLDKGHVEAVSEESSYIDRHFITLFPVEQITKKKIRVVFDSAAKHKKVALNDCLLQGPDLNNRLLGVLLRFRKHSVAFAADIECMFHCFKIPESQRHLLSFFWPANNDPSRELAVFQATVHPFGNVCSPAVAIYGLHKTATLPCTPSLQIPKSSRNFILENFYVDDGLGSSASVQEATLTLQGAIALLKRYNIRLHKIISSHAETLKAFPKTEICPDVESIELSLTEAQRTLGLAWHVVSDELRLNCTIHKTGFTRRVVLSVNGSLYDPLGLASPVALNGRLLQRAIFKESAGNRPLSDKKYWDEKLSDKHYEAWKEWLLEIETVKQLSLPRCYHPEDFGIAEERTLHVFCDASDDAIGHVVYMLERNHSGTYHVSFVFASSKVSPRQATTVPRLELCAATHAALSSQRIATELRITSGQVTFYSDSRVVLGYLSNTTTRFSRYVSNRVRDILRHTSLPQWRYVKSEENPADHATRPRTTATLLTTNWFTGPSVSLLTQSKESFDEFSEILPEEIKTTVRCATTIVKDSQFIVSLLRNGHWKKTKAIVIKVLAMLERYQAARKSPPEMDRLATRAILRRIQSEQLHSLKDLLENRSRLRNDHPLISLSPFLAPDGLIRVGGRITSSHLPYHERHPILLPSNHKVSLMIIRWVHEKTMHQGRRVTMGELREQGFFIRHGRRLVDDFLKNCAACRRFRANCQNQRMADLPDDRVEKVDPFRRIGIDVFGPFFVHQGRRTRTTVGTKKIWVLLITCLYSRAIHLEILNSMSTNSFMLALKRLICIRGPCDVIRSDCGSNFIGAIKDSDSEINLETAQKELASQGILWKLNPPGASHFGGAWERKIGQVKCVLRTSIKMFQVSLSLEEFSTLLAESSNIVNNTPLAELTSDPNDIQPITPNMLLRPGGERLPASYEPSETDLRNYGKKRWSRVLMIADMFWKRWKQDYLATLRQRSKWNRETRHIKVGDVVLIRDKASRNKWPLGIVEEVIPGIDKIPRRANIRLKPTASGVKRTMQRSIHDLVILVKKEER